MDELFRTLGFQRIPETMIYRMTRKEAKLWHANQGPSRDHLRRRAVAQSIGPVVLLILPDGTTAEEVERYPASRGTTHAELIAMHLEAEDEAKPCQ